MEEGEECDCGFDDNECAEKCCFPRKSSALSEEDNKRNRCKRKAGVQCSPSEGPCCSHSCYFVDRSERVQCAHEQDCTEPAVCDGTKAKYVDEKNT